MQRSYEDLQAGEEHEFPGRTITEADMVNLSAISDDGSPVHTDKEDGKRSPYKSRIAHGLLGLAAVKGLKQRIPAFVDVRCMASLYWNQKFTGPILIADTVRIRVMIASEGETKRPDRGIVVEYITILNQRGKVVQDSEHGLMALRKAPV